MYFYNEETENTLVDYNYWSMYNYCFTNLKNTVIIHKMRMFISKSIYITKVLPYLTISGKYIICLRLNN